jgi:hypothetical protein
MIGIDWTFRLLQAANVLILVAWLLPAILALIRLRRRQLDDVARVLWLMVVVLVPLVGQLAFLILRPGRPGPDDNEG